MEFFPSEVELERIIIIQDFTCRSLGQKQIRGTGCAGRHDSRLVHCKRWPEKVVLQQVRRGKTTRDHVGEQAEFPFG